MCLYMEGYQLCPKVALFKVSENGSGKWRIVVTMHVLVHGFVPKSSLFFRVLKNGFGTWRIEICIHVLGYMEEC
jgi:hypothetical protein